MDKSHPELLVDLGSQLNALLAASRAVVAASSAHFHPTVQPAAYQVAVALMAHGPAKAGDLARLLDMDKSAISRLGKSLCSIGLAETTEDPHDGRGIVYGLTAEGIKRVYASNATKSVAFFSRLEGWSDDELIQFTTLLRKFNRL